MRVGPRGGAVFVLLAGCTEISKVPGLTAAGAAPELTFLTPAIDSEIIVSGHPLSVSEAPMTPDGIPTPALITRAALELTGTPVIVVNAGFGPRPATIYVETALGPALDPIHGEALPDMDRALETGRQIGELLEASYDEIFLAESVPGGTTTAYFVLRSLGYELRTSSSMVLGPDDERETMWKKLQDKDPQEIMNPLAAVKKRGDYMMALSLGISRGVRESKLHFCGGTQMATVYHIDKLVNNPPESRDVITTQWIMDHRSETMHRLAGPNIIAAGISLKDSEFEGLRQYEKGHVREGAGMGGAYYLASRTMPRDAIMQAMGRVYMGLVRQNNHRTD